MKHPSLITKSGQLIDHQATGLAAKKYRESAGLTQLEVAEHLQVSQECVAQWEGGRPWSVVKLARFCRAVDEIFKRVGHTRKPKKSFSESR